MPISINTAQNVRIEYKTAGVAERMIATIIDLSILLGISYILVFVITMSNFLESTPVIIIIITVLSAYHLISELVMNGCSIGKSALHLRVVKLDGSKLSFWDYLLRWVLRLIDITICFGFIAITSIITTSKAQRLGDLAAGTTVIRETKAATLSQLGKYTTPDDYQVAFPQANILTDKDIVLIKKVLYEVEKHEEYKLLTPLAQKIKELTGSETAMNDLDFVKTILKDYIHLTRQ